MGLSPFETLPPVSSSLHQASVHSVGIQAASSSLLEVSSVVIAVLALGWTVTAAVRQWPRIRVVRRQDARVGGISSKPGEQYTFIATVVNMGTEAVTIEDVGWQCTSGGFSQITVHRLRLDAMNVKGPEVPCRVEGHGTATWEIGGEIICSQFGRLDENELYAWAHRFAGRRGWPWSDQRRFGLRTYESDRMPSPCPIAIREHRERMKLGSGD